MGKRTTTEPTQKSGAAAPKRGPGRPRTGKTKATVSISFDLDILVWLAKEGGTEGQISNLVNAKLRRLMEAE